MFIHCHQVVFWLSPQRLQASFTLARKARSLSSVIKASFYTMVTTSGVFQIKPECLQLKSSRPFVARVQWPTVSGASFTKNDLKLWLSQLSCNPDDQLGMSPEEWSTHTVLPCPANIPEMEDQHLWFGWCLVSSQLVLQEG